MIALVLDIPDSIDTYQSKIEEWMDSGCELAWLIDIDDKKVYIYRKDASLEVLIGLDRTLYGENVLPGFELNLKEIE
jgi:Uma2 family endonuclease